MFKHLMKDKVEILSISGFDSYNRPIAENKFEIICKLEFCYKKILNALGEEIISSGEIRTLQKLSVSDTVKVSGEYRDIISVCPQRNLNRDLIYYIIYFA